MKRLPRSMAAIVVLFLSISTGRPSGASEPISCPECDDCVRRVLAELEERGWLGMALHLHGNDVRNGLEIQFLAEGGPAAELGLQPGDRVMKFQGIDLTEASPEGIVELLQSVTPGERVVLEVVQGKNRRKLTLRAQPMSLRAKAEALGSYLIRAAALERKRRGGEGEGGDSP